MTKKRLSEDAGFDPMVWGYQPYGQLIQIAKGPEGDYAVFCSGVTERAKQQLTWDDAKEEARVLAEYVKLLADAQDVFNGASKAIALWSPPEPAVEVDSSDL